MLLKFLLFLLFTFFVSGSNVCICECCHPGQICLTNLNSTFTINNCDECTTDFCFGKVFECRDFLSAKCVNRDSLLNIVPNYTFLIVVSVLLTLAAIKKTGKLEQINAFIHQKLARFTGRERSLLL